MDKEQRKTIVGKILAQNEQLKKMVGKLAAFLANNPETTPEVVEQVRTYLDTCLGYDEMYMTWGIIEEKPEKTLESLLLTYENKGQSSPLEYFLYLAEMIHHTYPNLEELPKESLFDVYGTITEELDEWDFIRRSDHNEPFWADDNEGFTN